MEHDLKRGDFLSGIGLAILGGYILYAANQWTLFNEEGPGPGFFPMIYGIIMLGAALVLTFHAARRPAAAEAEEDAPRGNRAAALWTWVALAASLPLMSVLGFVIGFGLVLFFIIKVVFRQPLLKAAITAGAITVALHLLFPELLGVPLPPGMYWNF